MANNLGCKRARHVRGGGPPRKQAQLHFPQMPPAELARIRRNLRSRGILLEDGIAADERLHALRRMYEPYVHALSEYLLMPLPAWEVAAQAADNWQTSAWERVAHV